MPVVGDPETMNNTFVEQIVGAAKAAIDTLDAMGVIDPKRVVVSGHSYGAFMTANLLAHSDLFVAGIARSGAYKPRDTNKGCGACSHSRTCPFSCKYLINLIKSSIREIE
jgi:dipeptidyl aminopeptidase/acylaminoacyl peptidase